MVLFLFISCIICIDEAVVWKIFFFSKKNILFLFASVLCKIYILWLDIRRLFVHLSKKSSSSFLGFCMHSFPPSNDPILSFFRYPRMHPSIRIQLIEQFPIALQPSFSLLQRVWIVQICNCLLYTSDAADE